MKNGANTKNSRRHFFRNIGILFLTYPFWEACQKAVNVIKWRMLGANFSLGHRLLTQDFPPPSEEKSIKILIIGAGITGLSACRQLLKKGEKDFLLLEIDNKAGGNSASGENEFTQFPLGAHYLPLPNLHDQVLIDFLAEEKIITHFDGKNEPVFEETFLAFAPQERLFINHKWQEGLLPSHGVSEDSLTEIQRFFQKMDFFKNQKGSDGKYFFDVPLKNISADKSYQHWDNITMKTWLLEQNFTSPELLEHVNYACLDDFGLGIENVSAWAGIHYFSARKNKNDNVLTWQEGNGYLVKCLEKYAAGKILKQHLAYQITNNEKNVSVKIYNEKSDKSLIINAEKVILATPQFVNQRLLPSRKINLDAFHYAPWLVATLTLSEKLTSSSVAMCWDNVIFKGKGLGYINTQHQHLAQKTAKNVITYYCAFDGEDSLKIRRDLYKKSEQDWIKFIVKDLSQAHPNIESLIENVEIQLWGHGMISPKPNFIFGENRESAAKTIENRIFFAHSDLSGMSLFEEAFHQGIDVVEKLL